MADWVMVGLFFSYDGSGKVVLQMAGFPTIVYFFPIKKIICILSLQQDIFSQRIYFVFLIVFNPLDYWNAKCWLCNTKHSD